MDYEDAWLDGAWEERYELPDYEVWEMNQLDLDREFDADYGDWD